MSKQVAMSEIPNCDVCAGEGKSEKAYADAKLSIGPWGYVCREHFAQYGCSLGLGRGQELVIQLDEVPPSQHERIAEKLKNMDPAAIGFEEFLDIFEDRDPAEFL
ncbi:MAG: hypothetical protein WBZ37_06005 [Mycobacterium sp.]